MRIDFSLLLLLLVLVIGCYGGITNHHRERDQELKQNMKQRNGLYNQLLDSLKANQNTINQNLEKQDELQMTYNKRVKISDEHREKQRIAREKLQ